ncbi:TonB-dependent receptor [Oceanihabitans sediminis]|uniref:SusC/RagA family TonB-linked outer membrane protein n=1 Tax=Oceanihabitans sediminis TaxID=1812012 RepID=UPI00299E468D|nr:TonB-dependent receptor [Oceanihabitans sediminis]MDX1773796.1 TonB-dependent receptor [Oceanihabitans sediminis]
MKTKFSGILTLLLAFVVQISFAQEKTISGTVSDEMGLPLPTATVIIKGTTSGVSTDFDGNYTIKAKTGDVLNFSYVGYATVSRTVGTSNTINVSLQPDNALEEVVITALGARQKDELTSAVSNVSAEDLEKIAPSVSIDNMLQGQAAGVQVTAQNGKPGQTAFIRIRGIGSINAGNEPLYIVDGAQMDESFVNGINPSDIENISVLKDAASTSIYGARGGNGVVLVTTKRGKVNKGAQFSLSSRVSSTRKIKDNFEMMDAAQKLQYERELGLGTGAGLANQADYNRLVDRNTDWQDELLKDGFIQSINFSAVGGEEKINYFFSVGNDEDSGIIQDIDAYNRTTARLNVDYQAKDWVKIGTSLGFSSMKTGDPRDRNNAQNPIRAMYDYNPYETKWVVDGDNNLVLDANGNKILNENLLAGYPVTAELTGNTTDRFYTRIFGNGFLDFTLTDKLSFKTQVSGVYERYRRENFLHPGSVLDLIVNSQIPTGSKIENGSFDLTYSWLNKVTYNTDINDIHRLQFNVFSEYVNNDFRSYSATGKGFPLGGPSTLNVAATPDAVGGSRSQYTLFSLAANVDYNYDGRYILNATVRRDGSSRFGENTKYGNFYSGSLAWNVDNEDFFNVDAINTLRLRASAGTSGNDQIGNYSAQTLYGFNAYNGNNALVPAQYGSADLGWEQNFSYGVGVEFGLFENRVRGLVDYYNRTTSDLLLSQRYSYTLGGFSILGNLGEMVNKGLEFELSVDILRDTELKWSVNGNVNLYDNEVTKLVNDEDLFTASNFYTILRVGEEVDSYYITEYAGVNPANGEALYYDTEGNITNNPNGNEKLLSGKSPYAKLDGSFATNLAYKGFDLSANFYFKTGNYIYNLMEQNMLNDGTDINSNQRVEAFNYWTPGTTNSDVLPRPTSASYSPDFDTNTASTRFLQKGDYIRLRSLQLGYNLPSKFTDKLSLDALRVYAAGNNLWTYAPHYKGDPEVGIGSGETQEGSVTPGEFSLYSYPTTRTLSFGIDVKF